MTYAREGARDAARCHSNVYPKKKGSVCSFCKLSTAHTLSLPTEKGSRRCESCKSSRVQTRKDGLWKLHGGRQPSTAACSRCRLEILHGRFCSHSACFADSSWQIKSIPTQAHTQTYYCLLPSFLQGFQLTTRHPVKTNSPKHQWKGER